MYNLDIETESLEEEIWVGVKGRDTRTGDG